MAATAFVYFFFGAEACGISVPRPGIEPVLPAVEAQSANHWTTREVQPLFTDMAGNIFHSHYIFLRKHKLIILFTMFCTLLYSKNNYFGVDSI